MRTHFRASHPEVDITEVMKRTIAVRRGWGEVYRLVEIEKMEKKKHEGCLYVISALLVLGYLERGFFFECSSIFSSPFVPCLPSYCFICAFSCTCI
jgi:hypothetical protein